MAKIIIKIQAVIHVGDNTHNQDQLILLVNFNTVNINVMVLINPIPPFLIVLFFIIKLSLFNYNLLTKCSILSKAEESFLIEYA